MADLSHSWSIEANELKLESLLGEGTSAKVYKGKYRGQEVAVKVLKVPQRKLEKEKKREEKKTRK